MSLLTPPGLAELTPGRQQSGVLPTSRRHSRADVSSSRAASSPASFSISTSLAWASSSLADRSPASPSALRSWVRSSRHSSLLLQRGVRSLVARVSGADRGLIDAYVARDAWAYVTFLLLGAGAFGARLLHSVRLPRHRRVRRRAGPRRPSSARDANETRRVVPSSTRARGSPSCSFCPGWPPSSTRWSGSASSSPSTA